MYSMTGFATVKTSNNLGDFTLELKSYNSRYLDVFINLPYDFRFLEQAIRERIQASIKRGKIEFNLQYKKAGKELVLNNDALGQFKNLLNNLQQADIKLECRLKDLESFGVFSSGLDDIEVTNQFHLLIDNLLEQFIDSRKKEGDSLKKDLSLQCTKLKDSLEVLKSLAIVADDKVKETLQNRFIEVVGNDLSQNRILEEIAVYLAKINIHEELVRLDSHINLLMSYLTSSVSVGKNIDFLAQELNREVNTIGSKTHLLEVQNEVLQLKETIENIREQARNVE